MTKNPIDLSSFTTRLESGEITVIAGLGDSLTYGWMVERSYFERLCDLLETSYPAARLIRVNAGIPGDTASGGFARIKTVLSQDPDIVIVQFGINDMFSDEDLGAFEVTIESIIQQIIGFNALPVLVVSCPLFIADDQEKATKYYDVLRKTGSKYQVPVADLDRFWRAMIKSRSNEGLYLADSVHPSDEGHALMAEGVRTLFSSHTIQSPPPV